MASRRGFNQQFPDDWWGSVSFQVFLGHLNFFVKHFFKSSAHFFSLPSDCFGCRITHSSAFLKLYLMLQNELSLFFPIFLALISLVAPGDMHHELIQTQSWFTVQSLWISLLELCRFKRGVLVWFLHWASVYEAS